jgi:hypothetical protein
LDSFGRIRTFQRVTANPNKKIFSPVTLSLEYHKWRFLSPGLVAGRRVVSIRPTERCLAHILFFRKIILLRFRRAGKLRPGAHIADPCPGEFVAWALPEFDHPKAVESLDTN